MASFKRLTRSMSIYDYSEFYLIGRLRLKLLTISTALNLNLEDASFLEESATIERVSKISKSGNPGGNPIEDFVRSDRIAAAIFPGGLC